MLCSCTILEVPWAGRHCKASMYSVSIRAHVPIRAQKYRQALHEMSLKDASCNIVQPSWGPTHISFQHSELNLSVTVQVTCHLLTYKVKFQTTRQQRACKTSFPQYSAAQTAQWMACHVFAGCSLLVPYFCA